MIINNKISPNGFIVYKTKGQREVLKSSQACKIAFFSVEGQKLLFYNSQSYAHEIVDRAILRLANTYDKDGHHVYPDIIANIESYFATWSDDSNYAYVLEIIPHPKEILLYDTFINFKERCYYRFPVGVLSDDLIIEIGCGIDKFNHLSLEKVLEENIPYKTSGLVQDTIDEKSIFSFGKSNRWS